MLSRIVEKEPPLGVGAGEEIIVAVDDNVGDETEDAAAGRYFEEEEFLFRGTDYSLGGNGWMFEEVNGKPMGHPSYDYAIGKFSAECRLKEKLVNIFPMITTNSFSFPSTTSRN